MPTQPYAYADLATLRSILHYQEFDTSADANLLQLLRDVSEQIDHWTGRTFRIRQMTWYGTPKRTNKIAVPDLLALTSLKTDTSADRTYAQTWLPTDYDLAPFNAPLSQVPFTHIEVNAVQGTQQFIAGQKASVQVVGKFGYWERLVPSANTVQGGAFDSVATTLPLSGSSSDIQTGETILIGTEQIFVSDGGGGVSLTVERAVNGTTAAAHPNGTGIYRYRYPDGVRRACLLQAERIFRRSEAILESQGSPIGAFTGAPMNLFAGARRDLDRDVKELLNPFARNIAGIW